MTKIRMKMKNKNKKQIIIQNKYKNPKWKIIISEQKIKQKLKQTHMEESINNI